LLPFSPQSLEFQAIARRLRIKISGSGTFSVRRKHSPCGRNPKGSRYYYPTRARNRSIGQSCSITERARADCKSFPPHSEEIMVASDAGAANHGDPHSVPLISHWGLIPRLRCCWFSAAIAVSVFPLGMHPHSWLAQQLHSAAVSALTISEMSHCASAEQAVPSRSRSLHSSVQSVASQV